MKHSMNQHLVKVSNKSLVLQTIIDETPLSRATISQMSGLNKGTVSSLVNELLEEELIFESGPGESSGGRRPVMLHFNQRAGYSIGIDLQVNRILAVLTDLKGTIIMEQTMKLPSTAYSSVCQNLHAIIKLLIEKTPQSRYGIVGIGVGVPGIVNNSGVIVHAPNLKWKSIELKKELEQTYSLPVIIDNEANGGAYGEKMFGAAKHAENVIYISAGIGIGVGIILNNQLYRGVNGFSGEMGHTTIQAGGRNCICGNKGCWELYASERALLTEAKKVYKKDELDLDDLIQLANQNDETTLSIIREIGLYLGYGINSIMNTFNPNDIIIGNRLASLQSYLQEPIEEVTNQNRYQFQQDNLTIHFSSLATHSTALGMAAFASEAFIRPKEEIAYFT
ncbi:ROK family protein [Bacillus sp. JCM 19034]|uniref:ROK family protein n=1 Tax=Bacillus sp. JCM 19034 TaxID=1481928 RepID=UPI00351D5E86